MSYSTQLDIISFLPGYSENSTYTTQAGDERWEEEGNPLWSAIPYYFPDITESYALNAGIFDIDIVDINTTNILDNWLTGDMIDESYVQNYGEATTDISNKYEESGGLSGPRYKLKNTITIDVITDSNGNIDRSATTVTDSNFDGVSSTSVLEQEQSNNIKDEFSDLVVPGGYRTRWYDTEYVTIDGVDTLRISTVFGGYTQVSERISDLARSKLLWEFLSQNLGWVLESDLTASDSLVKVAFSLFWLGVKPLIETVPNIFHFVDFFVSADGTKYVRMWDASLFPAHAAYIDSGSRIHLEDFPWSRNEIYNANNAFFFLESGFGASGYDPYYAPHHSYLEWVRDERDDTSQEKGARLTEENEDLARLLPDISIADVPSHAAINHSTPIFVYGEDAGGTIPPATVESVLPNQILNPFVNTVDHSG